jgi:capsular exopolysaccharide synthesis family protein
MNDNKLPMSGGQAMAGRQIPRMAPMQQNAMALTPKEILDIFRRHILLIFILTFLGACFGGGAWLVLSKVAPKFTAKTYIEVLSPGQSDPTVIGSPVASKDIAYEFRFSKASLIKQQSMLQNLIRRDKIRETKWFKKFDDDVLKITDDLDKNLGAVADRNSNFILVSMTCGNPEEAALIVNQMVELFIKSQQDNAETDVSAKLSELTQQETELRGKLQSLNSSLADIRRSTGITQLEGTDESNFRHTVTEKLGNLEVEKSKLEADIEEIRTSVTNYEERNVTNDVVQRTTENDPVILGLLEKISAYEAELARKMTNLGENHREVQQIREMLRQTIAEKDSRIAAKAKQIRDSDVTTARDQFAVLTNRLAKLEELRAQTESQQRDLDNTRALYDQHIADREETKTKLFATQEQISKYNLLKQDTETAKVKSVGLAPAPLKMSSPIIYIYIPAGTFLGLMLAIGLAFLIEFLNDLLRTPRDVMKYAEVPLLGMVIHKNIDAATRKADMWKVVRQQPFSMMSECYRQFRTNLKLTVQTEGQKIILVTSGNAGEGRTTAAANMASTFAAEGNKVLLIDANFRRPCIDKIFLNGHDEGVEQNERGLSGYLIGKREIQNIIRHTDLEGTDVIDSGVLPRNPAEMLGGQRMRELLEYGKKNYDRIIIDGPPMLVSDAKALAARADGTVIVFNTAITRRGTAQRIVRELKEINTNVLGAILIGVRVLKGGYYHEMMESYHDYQDSHSKRLEPVGPASVN